MRSGRSCLAALLALSCLSVDNVAAQADVTEAAATLEVYVALLRDRRLTERSRQQPMVLVERHTGDPSRLWTLPDLPPEARPKPPHGLPDIPQHLLDRLLERLADARALPADLPDRAAVTFVDESELKSIFGSGLDGWDRFYKRYPKASGFLTLSRIAFDDAFSQALLFVDHTYGMLGAQGSFVFLRKTSKGWTIEKIQLFYES
jgi:hypothetical protein